jgi:hypothetical protein
MLRFATDENFNENITRGLLRRQPELDIVRVRDTAHMAINLDSTGNIDPRTGRSMTVPVPKNMSGGGIWCFPDLVKPDRCFLAGLTIEWHSVPRILVAVKIRIVLGAIHETFKDIREVLEDAGYQPSPGRRGI